jgi:pullulanase/glycogen debranching enzyme
VTGRIEPGAETPLGATWDGAGVSFALFSEHATAVELCLFDAPDAAAESARMRRRAQRRRLPRARPRLRRTAPATACTARSLRAPVIA